MQAPRTHAIIGRATEQTFHLSALTASFRTPFVSTIITSLDDLPLKESHHILITALAQDKQTGARYNSTGTVLEATGTAPLLLEPVQATLREFAGRAALISVTPCGSLRRPTVPISTSRSPQMEASPSTEVIAKAYYYEVKRVSHEAPTRTRGCGKTGAVGVTDFLKQLSSRL